MNQSHTEVSQVPDFPTGSCAHVPTERPARYGKQLTSHMGRKIQASWDEEARSGRLLFDREGPVVGVVDLTCQDRALVLSLRTDAEHLEGLEHVVGIHLARFGAKDAMSVSWVRADGSKGTVQGPLSPQDMERMRAERQARRSSASS